MSNYEKQNSISVIRDEWNAQADKHNQFDSIGKEEVEQFANTLIKEARADAIMMATHSNIQMNLSDHKDSPFAISVIEKYRR